MLFNKLIEVADNYGSSLAINDLTYTDLINCIHKRKYTEFSSGNGVDTLFDIFKAASIDKPILIKPLNGNYFLPDLPDHFALILYSSGSTGIKKPIYLTEEMIVSNAGNAIRCQNLTNTDRILTVCSMNHTGGINAQTIPGLLSGGHVIIEQFNPFNYLRLIYQNNITVSHLVPRMVAALMQVDSSQIVPSLRMIMCGSDCVQRTHAEFWLKKNIQFYINYGMTEAGPIILNHCFTNCDELDVYDHGIPLGRTSWCDVKIVENELYLRGKNIVVDDWLATDDCVDYVDGWYMYKGRKSAGCKIIPKSY